MYDKALAQHITTAHIRPIVDYIDNYLDHDQSDLSKV